MAPGLLDTDPTVAPAGPGSPGPQAQSGLLPSPTDVPAGEGDETNVSPEEQAQYDQFVTNGMRLINDKKGLSKLLKSIEGAGNPVEGLANTVASIVIRVEDSAKQKNVEMSPDVLMHGGTELLEQAAELAEAAGIHEFSEQDLENALNIAMDIYRTTRQQQGKLPTEQLSQDLQEVQAAEQGGELEQMFPGITEVSQRPLPEGAQPSGGQPPGGQPPSGAPAGGSGGLLR